MDSLFLFAEEKKVCCSFRSHRRVLRTGLVFLDYVAGERPSLWSDPRRQPGKKKVFGFAVQPRGRFNRTRSLPCDTRAQQR